MEGEQKDMTWQKKKNTKITTADSADNTDRFIFHPCYPRYPRFNLFRFSRRGSVLLICVVLLLLMAILGTAYLSTTRVDRVTSSQDVANSQIDTLIDGVRDLAASYIVNSLFAYNNNGYQYRGVTSANTVVPYNNYDIPIYNYNNPGDSWLADRVPVTSAQVPGASALPSGILAPGPCWAAITAPLNGATLTVTGAGAATYYGVGAFEDPTIPPTATVSNTYNPYYPPPAANVANPQMPVYPTFKPVNGVNYPALELPNGTSYVAGDADGDGIADCGLIRLPGVYADGLTYYAGIRIIDNNSAINVNTAVDNGALSGAQSDGTGGVAYSYAYGFFPANVGLAELLANSLEGLNVTQYQVSVGMASSVTYPPGFPSMTEDDGQTTVPGGYAWGSLGDLLAAQVAHRLGNPGFYAAGARAQVLPLGDQVDLAYHGGLFANPRAFTSSTSAAEPLSVTETLLPNSVFYTADNLNSNVFNSQTTTSYSVPPNATAATISTTLASWFNYNYNYTSPASSGAMIPTVPSTNPPDANPRPLLVVRNPVSNTSPISDPDAPNQGLASTSMFPYANMGRWQANVNYFPGDFVTYKGTVYCCILSPTPPLTTPPAPGTNWVTQQSLSQAPYLYVTGQSYSAGAVVAYPYSSITNSVTVSYNYPNYGGATPPAISLPAPTRYYISLTNNNTTTPGLAGSNWRQLTGTPVKTCVNTADFPELFRAYWSAMTADGDPNATPLGNEPETDINSFGTAYPASVLGNGIYTGNQFTQPGNQSPPAGSYIPPNQFPSTIAYHRNRMFRSSIRDPRPAGTEPHGVYLPPPQQLMLRAALAAVNTLNLRNGGYNTATIPLEAVVDGVGVHVTAAVYGVQKQPYISEVYCNTDVTNPDTAGNAANNVPYVAIKLCNPYSTPLKLDNWQFASVNRQSAATTYSSTGGGGSSLAITSIATIPGGTIVPGANGGTNGYLLIDNWDGTQVHRRPGETGLALTGTIANNMALNTNYLSAPGLNLAVSGGGSELVLLKQNGTGLYNFIPIDSFDFTNISDPKGGTDTAWHYARGDGPPGQWQFVYPGRYDGSQTINPRHQGTEVAQWNASGQVDPWDPNNMPAGSPPTKSGNNFTLMGATAQSTYPTTRPVQVAVDNWPSQTGTMFPFGQFARNGDILMVPYFGAYEIYAPSGPGAGTLIELNSAPIDSAFADDTVSPDDATYDSTVQLGRFSPNLNDLVTASGTATAGGSAAAFTLTDPNLQAPAGSRFTAGTTTWMGWDVLVTVSQAGSLNLSEIRHVTAWSASPPTLTLDAPVILPSGTAVTGTVAYSLIRPYSWTRHLLDYLTIYSPRDDYLPNTDPNVNTVQPVANENAAVSPSNSSLEDTVGVDGLININTAPWRVLAALPLVMQQGATPPAPDNYNSALLAQQIVADRQQYGPFKTLFELNRVVNPANPAIGFQNAWGQITPSLDDTNQSQGNLQTPTSLLNQFNELNLQVTRLSNLITTRSDTFTVYIVLEGWQNAGTSTAQLILTRRAAFIVDRNTVTPTSRTVRTVTVPNN